MKLLDELFNPNIIYRATGIFLNDLNCSNKIQTTLFEELKQTENDSLAKTIDKLEKKFGKNTIRTGF